MTYAGGCQCGAIRFEISSDPIVAYCCHCTDCQQQSSSAFGMSVWFAGRDFKLLSGTLSIWKTTGDSGNEKVCAFCPECGTRIYHGFSGEEDSLSVKGGALDRIADLPPVAHIWTQSAQPWMRKAIEGEWCFEQEPETFDDLIARFSAP